MPTQVTNYQCPACTGPLHFVGASGKLECEYCGASYDVAKIEALYAQKEEKAAAAQQAAEETGQSAPPADDGAWDTSSLSEDWGAEGNGMRAYSCPSCGADVPLNSAFCSAYGAKIPQTAPAEAVPADSPLCPSCHAPVRAGSRFCICCGAKLESGEE